MSKLTTSLIPNTVILFLSLGLFLYYWYSEDISNEIFWGITWALPGQYRF